MKSEHKVILLTVLGGVLYWVLGAGVGLWFSGKAASAAQLLLGATTHDAVLRLVGLAAILCSGAVLSLLLARSRRALAASKASEREMTSILNSLSEQVVYHDLNDRIRWANRAATESIGLSVPQLIGAHCEEVWDRRKVGCRVCPVLEASRTGQPHEAEMATSDGRCWQVRGYPMRDHRGRIIGAVEITTDVSARKQAEEALRESGARYRQLVETMNEGMGVADENYVFTYVNESFAGMLGYCREEMIGHHLTEFVHADSQAFMADQMAKRRTGQAGSFEMAWAAKDGRKVYILASPRGLFDAEGRFTGSFGVLTDITERKHAEEQVEDLAKFPSENPSPVLRIARDGLLLYANESGRSLLSEWGCRIGQTVPGTWRQLVEEVLDSDCIRGIEVEHRDRILSFSVVPVSDAGYANLYALDITERKRGEEALRQYQRAVEGSEDLIAGVDRKYAYILVNEAFLRYHGLSRDKVIGQTVPSVVGADVFEKEIKPHVDRCFQGQNVRYEMLHRSPAGDEHYLEVSYYPLNGETQPPTGLVAVMRDITDRRQAQQAVQRERDFAHNVVETSQALVLVLDVSGRILRLNRFAQELTGYTEEEVLGIDRFETFLLPKDRRRVREDFQRALSGQLTPGSEYAILAKDGREILIRWFYAVLRDGLGNVAALLAVGHDVTEIRQTERQLRQAAKMEAVGRLAGGMAHDFNNMLAIIQGYADLLSKALAEEHELYDDMEKIRAASRRAASLTKRLLALGRKQISQPQAFQLNDTLHDMGSILRRTLGEDIDLVTELAEGLWPVKADPTQIEEVILNLVLNSREAMPQGGKLVLGTANVTEDVDLAGIGAKVRPGEYVMLTVSDTGTGISRADQAHIFEPFFTTKQDTGGTGLGLAVCYGVISQSDGHIHVSSKPGEGTTFRVYLPRSAEAPAEKAPPPAGICEPVHLPTGRETILVAEDEQDVRQLIVRVLRECGYTVLETGNARETLPLGRHYEGDIDLLIADVVMPGMNGKKLAGRLKRTRPAMEVLYISGYAEEVMGHHGVLAEGVNFLAKPFPPRQIAETVRRILDSRRRPAGLGRPRRTRRKKA